MHLQMSAQGKGHSQDTNALIHEIEFLTFPNFIKSVGILWSVLTDYGGLQIDEDSPGDVLAGAGLAKEGVEGVITASNGLVTGHLAIRLDPVLQAVQLPASITDLDTGLSDMDGDALTLWQKSEVMW